MRAPDPGRRRAWDCGYTSATVCDDCDNEADDLAFVIGQARECVKPMPGSAEILIVDDGSTDGTGAIGDELAAAYPEDCAVFHGTNRGFGGAIASCLRRHEARWSTGRHDPRAHPREHLQCAGPRTWARRRAEVPRDKRRDAQQLKVPHRHPCRRWIGHAT